MSDDTPEKTPVSPADGEGDKSAKGGSNGEKESKTKETVSKAELNALSAQLKEAREALKAYQDKEQEEADKNKTAQQKADELAAKAAKLERELSITRLAAKKGLDPDLFDRIKGDTEAEIEADIDLLLTKFVRPTEKAPPDTKGGKTQPGGPHREEDGTPTKKQDPYLIWRNSKLKK
jgi:DNA-binding transcriptional MerR regulator